MGMTVLVIFGFDDFFELFFLQDAMIRTASVFNDLGKKKNWAHKFEFIPDFL